LPEKPPLPLPDKPSIAVLPFVNMSGDPEQEYFSDGISEEIITALSKVPNLFVIARNSSFTYKGKPIKVQQVGRELGVKYVLEGSVRKTGDKVRITAQFVDATTGNHLWAERYDRELKDVFAIQDEITMKVITELQVKLTEGEYARIAAIGTNNIEAYLKCLNAIRIWRRMTKEDNLLARKMLNEAIALDTNYPWPYIYLGWTHWFESRWSKSREDSLAHAEELARKGLEMNASLGLAHMLLSFIHKEKMQWDKCLAEAERAANIDLNWLNVYGLARALTMVGRHEEAIPVFKEVFRLDPMTRAMYRYNFGLCYFMAEQYEDALKVLKQALDGAKKGEFNPFYVHRGLAATYSMLGQEEEARHHAAEVLRIRPKYSLKSELEAMRRYYKKQADRDRLVEALRKAGLPD
jgi:TolB-like protein/Tfp pilus assembly protein PilF